MIYYVKMLALQAYTERTSSEALGLFALPKYVAITQACADAACANWGKYNQAAIRAKLFPSLLHSTGELRTKPPQLGTSGKENVIALAEDM